MMLSMAMDHDNFTASNGWLECWQKRYSVKLATLSGESAEVPQDVVDDWSKRLPALTEGYVLADIYNADETGLYFRALPSRSMVIKGDPRKGIKTSKDRITVLLACSAAGEKLTPLVIGKAANPRCFRGVDKALIPVTYRSNRKAWMTGVLFSEWLERLNAKVKAQKRNILMFLDNCGAHPKLQFSNIKLVFLPPNTTSRLQPCDAGIIATLKAHYRKRLVRHVLAEMDTANTATELSKRVNVLDAIGWLWLAWCSVSPSTIVKCFAHCGFVEEIETVADEADGVETVADEADGVEQVMDGNYDVLMGDVSWQDFVTMDDRTLTTDIAGDDWEAAIVARARGESPEDDDADDSGEDEAETLPVITARDALTQIKDVVGFALGASDARLLEVASTAQDLLQGHCIRQAALAQQKTITDFFKKQ